METTLTRIRSPEPVHLLVYALGNHTHPHTRHSLAQHLIPGLLERWSLRGLELERKHQCWMTSGRLPGVDTAEVTIVRPKLAMNISGQPVPFLLKSSQPPPLLLVLHDSLEHAPLAIVQPRFGVSAKGHNGLRSIESSLKKGTAFWRMGLGIGRPAGKGRDGVGEWVLGKLSYQERLFWDGEGVNKVAEQIEAFMRDVAAGKIKQR